MNHRNNLRKRLQEQKSLRRSSIIKNTQDRKHLRRSSLTIPHTKSQNAQAEDTADFQLSLTNLASFKMDLHLPPLWKLERDVLGLTRDHVPVLA
eukprot:CAMPEP_0172157614 /NCGR_PEP_ID=MMETSP1050-20130122/3889_1 /TAXON_ID=233186 /ORGANISM="Cryptomonas curvata, Strain CCAP979/52" /LENGTH=93 /DNA_ID=CAMNT_0012826863 /DNA_START=238 /DNA_END=516 /DNA_ORIENTATION=+